MNSNKDNIIEKINNGDTFLGIEFGSTRIKAVLILSDGTPVAQGSHRKTGLKIIYGLIIWMIS